MGLAAPLPAGRCSRPLFHGQGYSRRPGSCSSPQTLLRPRDGGAPAVPRRSEPPTRPCWGAVVEKRLVTVPRAPLQLVLPRLSPSSPLIPKTIGWVVAVPRLRLPDPGREGTCRHHPAALTAAPGSHRGTGAGEKWGSPAGPGGAPGGVKRGLLPPHPHLVPSPSPLHPDPHCIPISTSSHPHRHPSIPPPLFLHPPDPYTPRGLGRQIPKGTRED